MSNGYSFERQHSNAAEGRAHEDGSAYYKFKGPGMPLYANTVPIVSGTTDPDYHAARVAQMLALAFHAGRAEKAKELREALNEGKIR